MILFSIVSITPKKIRQLRTLSKSDTVALKNKKTTPAKKSLTPLSYMCEF